MSAHSEEEARALLGAGHVYGACMNGPCKQGHKVCPTPQACQVVMWDVEREIAHSAAAMFGRVYAMVRGWML